MENPTSDFVYQQWKMLINDWIDGLLKSFKDEDYLIEISPGKNHGVFILGHLVASDDDFSLYMGKGDFLFPEYQDMFASGSPLKPASEYPTVKEILEKWKAVCDKNEKIYQELTDAELSEYHELCKDPEKDWFKTKARVVQAWQLHQNYHAGQLAVIHSIAKSKEQKK